MFRKRTWTQYEEPPYSLTSHRFSPGWSLHRIFLSVKHKVFLHVWWVFPPPSTRGRPDSALQTSWWGRVRRLSAEVQTRLQPAGTNVSSTCLQMCLLFMFLPVWRGVFPDLICRGNWGTTSRTPAQWIWFTSSSLLSGWWDTALCNNTQDFKV